MERIDQVRWDAVRAREASGAFVYAVRTTGVYCRPGCRSRLPRRDNVVFYDSSAAATSAGFRACKRCRPDEPPASRAALIAGTCRRIEEAESTVPLAALAAEAGLSASHFHRVFKAATGVTPHAYARARRRARLQGGLQQSSTVTAAAYEAGFGSSAGFYAGAPDDLGMAPGDFRRGGRGEAVRFAIADCTLGKVLVAEADRGICTIALGDTAQVLARDLRARFPAAIVSADREFAARVSAVVALVDARATSLDVPLDIRGTAFQQPVWRALREVPRGATVSYGELAARLGIPQSTRAVASAIARNSLAIAVPCHRAIRSDGSLSGFRWGVERKKKLLERESGADPTLALARKRKRGLLVLRGFALPQAEAFLADIARIARAAPFRNMVVPGGGTMSVAMTNCGPRGWVTDCNGYRYESHDPLSGKPWPRMPEAFLALARAAAATGGFPDFVPDACLINRYAPGARMGVHQDRDEKDFGQPIVSVSLGLPATFLWGGAKRRDPVERNTLKHGDVVVWGGPERLFFHGVAPLQAGEHPSAGAVRFNLTFRRAG